MKTHRLKTLKVNFASLVDNPANQGAELLIAKRDETEPEPEPTEKIGRKISRPRMAHLKAAADAITAAMAGCDEEEDEMKDTKKATTEPETKADAAPETKPEATVKAETKLEPAADDIAKRLADLEKRAADAEARATEAESVAKRERDERLIAKYEGEAAEYKSLTVDPKVFGPILKRAHGGEVLSEADVTELRRVLKAADEAVQQSGILKEQGRSGGADERASEKIDRLAKALVADKKAADYGAAMSQLAKMAEHKALFVEYRAERN